MGIKLIRDRAKAWADASIISEAQAAQIVQFEERVPGRSWALVGFSIVGIVAIVVGIISLVAANWAEIPDNVKLGVYFALQAAIGAACVRTSDRPGPLYEGLVPAFALLLFAGIGLIGQIYHLESDGLSALRFWLILSFPLALTSARFLLPRLWFVIFGWALCLWFFDDATFRDYGTTKEFLVWYRGMFLIAVAFATIALSRLQRFAVVAPFIKSARTFGWFSFMCVVPLFANIIWASKSRHVELPWDGITTPFLALLFTAFLLLRAHNARRDLLAAGLQVATLSFGFVALLIPCLFDVPRSDLLGGLIFVFEFGLAAGAAALLGARRLFDLLTFILATRFVVAYFEVFGTLTVTGIGLIISGFVILGAVYLWVKLRRQVGDLLGVEL